MRSLITSRTSLLNSTPAVGLATALFFLRSTAVYADDVKQMSELVDLMQRFFCCDGFAI